MRDEHDLGLLHDLRTLRALSGGVDRRQLLRWMAAGAALLPLAGCGDDAGDMGGDAGNNGGGDGGNPGSCTNIPEETQGPYPGDGSNGANILTTSGVVRSDIRSSIGSLSGTAAGVPLTVKLGLVNGNAGCAALAGYAVYIWHCDREGNYSMYTLTTQNYLRGVQETGSDGSVSFTSIFPACYSGRWPHIHFEIYPSLAKAMAVGNKLRTSQLALPADACNAVYATTGYGASVTNLARVSLSSDMVFRDGSSTQVASVRGSVAAGYTAELQVAIAA